MTQDTPAALRRTAEEGARLAGRILAERFLGERTIEFKGGIDLVTDADRASEEALLAFIRERHPHHSILAEESGASQGTEGFCFRRRVTSYFISRRSSSIQRWCPYSSKACSSNHCRISSLSVLIRLPASA